MFIKDKPVAIDKIATLLISKEYLHIFNFFPAHKLFAKKQWKGLGVRRIF